MIPKPHDSSSVDRHFADSAPIEFWVDGRKGVRLLDAQTDNLLGLADADVEVMNALGVKVTYKIEVNTHWISPLSVSLSPPFSVVRICAI